MAKIKDSIYQMLTGMWSNWNSHTLLVKIQNGTVTLEGSLAFSYKIKHIVSNCTPWY